MEHADNSGEQGNIHGHGGGLGPGDNGRELQGSRSDQPPRHRRQQDRWHHHHGRIVERRFRWFGWLVRQRWLGWLVCQRRFRWKRQRWFGRLGWIFRQRRLQWIAERRLRWIVDANPLYHLLEIVRQPLLSSQPAMFQHYVVGLALAACLGVFAAAIVLAYSRRIVYVL